MEKENNAKRKLELNEKIEKIIGIKKLMEKENKESITNA
tara:strand:+ start:55 stop:171 length:117 start_codon:yes stop_codon:yes gene_type:complete